MRFSGAALWILGILARLVTVTSFSPPRHARHSTGRLAMTFDHFVSASTLARVEGAKPLPENSELSLGAYMRLPTSQYVCIPMPLKAKLTRLETGNPEADEFLLTVPPVRFPGVLEVKPKIWCKVTPLDDRVCITSERCELSGSPIITSTRLNERFRFTISTNFTWTPDDPPITQGSNTTTLPLNTWSKKPEITSRSRLEVWVDPPFMFRAIPKSVLEATGNGAMSLAIRQIEGAFIRALLKDYERWSGDGAYRETRARSTR
mmetsp:Transcript_30916/g.69451  ORF Transcript_30916/g.69451 Transcript_30916/m.69451 type:complete len:262 (+) Transcript_30916:461-1246(+)